MKQGRDSVIFLGHSIGDSESNIRVNVLVSVMGLHADQVEADLYTQFTSELVLVSVFGTRLLTLYV